MTVKLEIPDDLLKQLVSDGRDPARAIYEDAIAEAYRNHRLTAYEVGIFLGFATDMQVDQFLGKRQLFQDYSAEELEQDLVNSEAFELKRKLEAA